MSLLTCGILVTRSPFLPCDKNDSCTMGHETSTYLDLQNCQESALTDSALTSLVFFFKKHPTRSNSAIAQCKEGARKLVLLFFFRIVVHYRERNTNTNDVNSFRTQNDVRCFGTSFTTSVRSGNSLLLVPCNPVQPASWRC